MLTDDLIETVLQCSRQYKTLGDHSQTVGNCEGVAREDGGCWIGIAFILTMDPPRSRGRSDLSR